MGLQSRGQMDGHRELRPEERQQSGRTLTARCWKSSTLVMQIARLRSPRRLRERNMCWIGCRFVPFPRISYGSIGSAYSEDRHLHISVGPHDFGLASSRESGRLRDGVGIAFLCLTNIRQAASRPFPSARRPRRLSNGSADGASNACADSVSAFNADGLSDKVPTAADTMAAWRTCQALRPSPTLLRSLAVMLVE